MINSVDNSGENVAVCKTEADSFHTLNIIKYGLVS